MGLSRVSLGLDRHAQQTIHGGPRVAYGEWLKSFPRPCNTQDQGNGEVWKGASQVTGYVEVTEEWIKGKQGSSGERRLRIC